jgi:hypothetical protein
VHPTKVSGTVSFLYRNGAFADPVCVHLAARIGVGPSHCELIRLLECGVEQIDGLVLWAKSSCHRATCRWRAAPVSGACAALLDESMPRTVAMSCSRQG